MPPAIAIAASYFGTMLAGAGFLGLTGLAASLVGGVIAMGINSIASSLFGFNKSDSGGSNPASLTLNQTGAVNTIPVVYGARRVGGTRIFIDTTNSNKNLHLLYAICEGEITTITKIYFNNELAATFDKTKEDIANDGASTYYGFKYETKYANKAEFRMRYGKDGQAVIQKMQDNVGATKWSNEHKVSGIALLYANLTFDQSVYNGLPTVSVDVVGRKVPAAHITAGWASTDYDNPAWALYDYLTNTRYGKGLDPAMIDMASFLSTKAYCNEMVDMLDKDNKPITQKRYVADGHIDTGKTIIDNVKDILTSMNAFMIQSGGKYKVRCNKKEQLVDPITGLPNLYKFDESNITGAWDILLGTKTNRFNQVKLTYFEPENNYQGNIFLVKDATYLASDNNQTYERELTLPLTCNYNRAAYIGRIIMNQSRYQTTVTFNAVQTAMIVEVGDVISITHPVPGWVEKKFRVMNMTIQPAGDVRLVCVEYNADVYTNGTVIKSPDFLRQSTYTGGAGSQPNGNLTSSVTPPTNAIATVLTTGRQVTWTKSVDTNITSYEVTVTGNNPVVKIGITTNIVVFNTPITTAGTHDTVNIVAVNGLGYKSAPLTITINY